MGKVCLYFSVIVNMFPSLQLLLNIKRFTCDNMFRCDILLIHELKIIYIYIMQPQPPQFIKPGKMYVLWLDFRMLEILSCMVTIGTTLKISLLYISA